MNVKALSLKEMEMLLKEAYWGRTKEAAYLYLLVKSRRDLSSLGRRYRTICFNIVRQGLPSYQEMYKLIITESLSTTY